MGFDLTGLGSVADLAKGIIDRVLPDPAAKIEAAFKLNQLQQDGEFKLIDAQLQAMQMQAEVNKVEAGSSALFVSGWRPFIGWVCGSALVYQYILRPLLPWVVTLCGGHIDPPMGLDNIFSEIIMGMLGMGGLHSYDKLQELKHG